MSSLIESIIPSLISDDCTEQQLNCDGVPSAESGAGDIDVIFPEFLNGVFPLSGGSIVRFDLSSWNLSLNENVNTLIENAFLDFSNLNLKNNLESINKFRLEINKALLKIREFKILDSNIEINPPKIILSTYQGEDSFLVDNKSSSSIKKICKFKYIPSSAFNILLTKVLTDKNEEFKSAIGISGKTFQELLDSSVSLTEESLVALILEFFTIFNIDEDSLAKIKGPPVDGGYYTIFDKKIYIKMPDITGRDSAGFYSDIFDFNSNFYIEASKSRKSYGRGKFDSFALPINSTIDENIIPITDSEDIEILIDTIYPINNIKNAYLSILSKDQSANSIKNNLDFYSDTLELFSIPLLSSNDFYTNGKETINYDISLKNQDLNSYFKEIDLSLTSKETGIPYFSNEFSTSYFFGEKNRQEIVLTDSSQFKSIRKNDKKYFSPRAYGVIPVLANVRPKLYKNKPKYWIETNKFEEDNDKIKLIFDLTKFDNINFDELNNQAYFSLYLEDNFGQIFRASGGKIQIGTGIPTITNISPSGYKGTEQLLSVSDSVNLRFSGESLSSAIGINVKLKGLQSGNNYLFSDPFLEYTGSSTLSVLKINTELSYIGLESGLEYQIALIDKSGEIGNYTSIYISLDESEEQILKQRELASFKENEFSVKRFSPGTLNEIPILTNTNAIIKLKSRQRLFSGNFDIFAYVAVLEKDIATAIGGDDVATISFNNKTFYIPYNLEYEFSTSGTSDFGRQNINSRANILFPGNKYKDYNLFPLLNASSGSILFFYNKSIVEDLIDGFLSPEQNTYTFLTLGDFENKKPFILEPTIIGMIADISGFEKYKTTFIIEESNTDILESFSEKSFGDVGEISVFQKINKLGLIFSGASGSNLRSQYSFYIGNTKLSNITEKIKEISPNKFIVVFQNVLIQEEGYLPVRIEKNDKIFDYYFNGEVNRRASAFIPDNSFSYNSSNNSIILSEEISSFLDGNFEVNNDVNLLISEGNSGILFDQKNTTNEEITFLNELTVNPNVSTIIEEVTFNKDVNNQVNNISTLNLRVNSNEIFDSGEFYIDKNNNAIGFLNFHFNNGAIIKSNIPEIVSIKPSLEAALSQDISKINGSILKAGSEIKLLVKNTKKDFKVIFNNNLPAKIKGLPKKIGIGTYEATVTVPEGVINSDCIDICISNANSKRLRAKLNIGEKFVQNLEVNMASKLEGTMQERIPNVDDLKELIEDFPLRFAQIKLDKSLVPIDLINSFCDFSWHLTADLKVALNGFQTLLVPIQIILCIIDVICSLLHPGKLARAVIRLFYCLYDLLLLLPQISVPVMFLHLILHLLKLLECIILKIVEIINSINEIIKAIEIAVQQEIWEAIITLEEVLTQYLLELNVDLEVLEPITSVLAIFLEILQLVFNFPCPPDEGIGDRSCGIQGSMLAGIVSGKISPGDGTYDTSVLLPIAQYFTEDSILERISSNSGSTYEEYSLGDRISSSATDGSFYSSMNINNDSLRMTNGIEYDASFSVSFTKSTKGLGEPTLVKFNFNDKLNNSGFFNKKILDPLLNRDAPFHLLENNNGTLIVSNNKGNFISPIDGSLFLDIDGDVASVKPLSLNFEIPIMEPNPETGELEEVGVEEILRTFDDIPKMAIMDEESNLYFIEPNGITFNSENNIESIVARIINDSSAPKFRFTRDDQEVDTDGDGISDDEGRVFDLPQIFFVDMRAISEELQSACYAASYNEFLVEENDSDDISEIVEESSDCIQKYKETIKNIISEVSSDLSNGNIPNIIDLNLISQAHQDLIDCLNESADNMCKYVVNTLNSSFLIEEDSDLTPLSEYPVDIFDPVEFGTTTLEQDGPLFTGAREYAGGIGDSHVFGIGETATIRITPRDSYDLEMPGDLSEKINLTIISDTTGSAEIIKNSNGDEIEKIGSDYYIKIKALNEGEIKISASICNRTISAVTYAGLESSSDVDSVNCVSDAPSEIEESSATRPGALLKVDRILTLYYIKLNTIATVKAPDSNFVTTPQTFGTILEN